MAKWVSNSWIQNKAILEINFGYSDKICINATLEHTPLSTFLFPIKILMPHLRWISLQISEKGLMWQDDQKRQRRKKSQRPWIKWRLEHFLISFTSLAISWQYKFLPLLTFLILIYFLYFKMPRAMYISIRCDFL